MSEELNSENLIEVKGAPDQEINEHSQRGPYRQYEDEQTIIDKIRNYRRQRLPDSEIMKLLDSIPRRTYYNYVKRMQEQDKELIEQYMRENLDHVAEEYYAFRENASHMLRRLQLVIDDDKTPTREKLKAIQQYFDVTELLTNSSAEKRLWVIRALEERERKAKEEQKLQELRKSIMETDAKWLAEERKKNQTS